MNTLYINAIIAVLVVILTVFSAWYQHILQKFKKLQAKNARAYNTVTILGKLATWAVDQMETTGKAGDEKLAGATSLVNTWAVLFGLKVNDSAVQSAIETAVKTRKALNGTLSSAPAPELTPANDDVDDNAGSESEAKGE